MRRPSFSRARRDQTLAGPSPAFALLGETLVTGVLVAVASFGVVTAVPALVLAVRQLRAHLNGESYSLRTSLREFVPAVRAFGVVGTLAPAVLLVLWLNLMIVEHVQLPGAALVSTVSYLGLFFVTVLILRIVGSTTSAELPWLEQIRVAARRTANDPVGTALLLGAAAMVVAITLMLPALFIVVGGLLALAALAVEARS
ncbi:hypothetical protein [Kineosporia babensis]|uniref:DUF624 domain-containing protein n=1 Tax=Kineosporia babensis TaxID=499548 RepID=A0A9X1SYD5_9ACTN|nr:hypothetical protein [Kineosporia babensis]MCD5316240.1 hypothetical protein [Kineosporia babensis]